MEFYLVRTGYGTDILWCGSSGEAACKNAAAATGLPIVGFRYLPPEQHPHAA